MRFMRGFVVVMTLLGAGGGAAQAADAPGPPRELRDVKVEQRATAVAVTVATSGQPKYETTLLDSPVRLVIDISGTFASPRSHWTGRAGASQGGPREPVEARHGSSASWN